MKQLTLYYKSTCPFCQKVIRFMDANGIDIEMKSVFDSGIKDELVQVGGKNQVPCLLIDGKPLYESDDIIDFLRKEYLS